MHEEASGPRAEAAIQRMMDTLYGNGREGLTITVAMLKEAVIEIKDDVKEARADIKAIRAGQTPAERKPLGLFKWFALIAGSPPLLYALARGILAIAKSLSN